MNSPRRKTNIDTSWRFHRGDIPYEGVFWGWLKAGTSYQGGSRSRLDDSAWRRIDLPHDYAVEGTFTAPDPELAKPHNYPEFWPGATDGTHESRGALEVGVSWYRRELEIPEADEERCYYLQLDGIFRDSRFFLNDYHVGDHVSGYAPAIVDISDYVVQGQTNQLSVRVDPREPEGWFYEGAGIYRHAWLITTGPTHILPSGAFVHAEFDPDKPESAVVTVDLDIANRGTSSKECRITVDIKQPDGSVCGRAAVDTALPVWEESRRSLPLEVADPILWSLDSPALYSAEVRIEGDDGLLDSVTVNFGIRSAVFEADRGFLLNGKPLKLKGMCCHQDHAGVGAAIPDDVQEYRIRRLKSMGCNTYRAAHNPPTPEVVAACDRLGMLMLPENRIFSSSPDHIRQIESMVKTHRNNPSVILWSLGNEEMRAQTDPQGPKIARSLRRAVLRHDPTRPVTLAIPPFSWFTMAPEPLEPVLDTADEIDVMGFNYCDVHWPRFHELRPDMPIVVTEDTSSGPTRGCYRSDKAAGHLSYLDPYQEEAFTFEENWALVAEHDFLSGICIWTGFDYRGEPSPFGWPQVASQYGVMDSCGFPKDGYYYYRSQWLDEPQIHLFPHWNDPGTPDGTVTVYSFTNCDEAELLLNGNSMGRKDVARYHHVEWTGISYEAGVIEAVGYVNSAVAAKHRVETTDEPANIGVFPDHTKISRRGSVVVNLEIVDSKGRTVPTAANPLDFVVEGGEFLGAGNGDPACHEPDKARRHSAFNGLCQVILQAGGDTGEMHLTVNSPGLGSTTATIAII